jgi:hypothetical protein
MSIQLQISQSHYLDHFPICQEANAWSLQRKYMCRRHETLDCRKLHKQLSNSPNRSDKGHVWQLHGIFLWRFWPGGYLFFNGQRQLFSSLIGKMNMQIWPGKFKKIGVAEEKLCSILGRLVESMKGLLACLTNFSINFKSLSEKCDFSSWFWVKRA